MIEFNATFIIAMISFVVFMFIMNAIFYQPILNIIKKREGFVSSNYEEAKNISSQANDCKSKYETKLSEAKEQSREKVAFELEKAQRLSFNKIHEAKENAKNEIQSKKNVLQTEKEKLQREINVSDLSNTIINKIGGI